MSNPTNEQELDVILHIDGVKDYGVKVLKLIDVNKAKQAILDWHNKQIEELLDRLEAQWGETIDNTLGKPIRVRFVSVEAIEAERAKLKEVK